MKKVTHFIAAGVAALATLLCIPVVRDELVQIAKPHPYVSIVVGAVLSWALLYHNPTQPTKAS